MDNNPRYTACNSVCSNVECWRKRLPIDMIDKEIDFAKEMNCSSTSRFKWSN